MVRPLDVAWSILKLDFHIESDSAGHHVAQSHIDSENYASDMYERPVMNARRRTADFPDLSHPNQALRQMRPQEMLPFNSDLPISWPEGPADTPNFPLPLNDKFGRYHRGGSVPRLHEDGSYVGVNLDEDLAELMGRPHPAGERAFEMGAERIANIGAHEHTHRLINDEIEQWARQQTNIEALKREQQENIARLTEQYPPLKPHPLGLKPKTSHDVLVRAGLKPEFYGDEEYPETFNDMDVDQAKGSFDPLRSIGHEFGAYSLTPDSSSPTGFTTPEERIRQMGDRIYQGAEFYHPDPELRSDLSELHLAGPSEDQVRYEQMLQEQQAAGDVNPQTSVQ